MIAIARVPVIAIARALVIAIERVLVVAIERVLVIAVQVAIKHLDRGCYQLVAIHCYPWRQCTAAPNSAHNSDTEAAEAAKAAETAEKAAAAEKAADATLDAAAALDAQAKELQRQADEAKEKKAAAAKERKAAAAEKANPEPAKAAARKPAAAPKPAAARKPAAAPKPPTKPTVHLSELVICADCFMFTNERVPMDTAHNEKGGWFCNDLEACRARCNSSTRERIRA